MKYWHVMKDEGWVRITSSQRPYGRLVHLISPDCRSKLCGKNNDTILRESRTNQLRK